VSRGEPRRGSSSGLRRPSRADLGRLDEALRSLAERTGAPGLAVTLFTRDEVLYEAGIGHRDREARAPIDADTICGIASVTKSFTALAVQVLAADGLLRLDDPVTEHLPFTLWEHRRPATLRHLLSHTSGLPPTPTMTWLRAASQAGDAVASAPTLREALTTVTGGPEELGRRAAEVATFDGLVAYLNANVELLGEPGELFSYSNDAYCLLGGVVERASGRPLEAFLAERVLAPLGMTRTTFDLDRVMADANAATLYERDEGGEVRRSPAWQTTGRMLGGGMLKSTLRDLRTWVRFLMAPESPGGDGRPLCEAVGVPAASVREMASGEAWCGPGARYGRGLREAHLRGLRFVGHSGGLKGVSSYVGWVPDLGVGAVVLTNLGGLPSEKAFTTAIGAYAGLPPDAAAYEPAPYEAAPHEVEEVLGSYASGEPYGRLRLFEDAAGALRAAVGFPAVEVPAFMAGPSEVALRYPEYDAPVTLLRRDGRVWAAHHGSRVLESVRSA
jgi:CubicO group peptidase (beta-lactamase class C family)